MRALAAMCCAASLGVAAADERPGFVRVSPRDCRYFELDSGQPYLPIGLNLIAPPKGDPAQMDEWFGRLAAQGGNYVRVWLGSPFYDVEHARSGEYDEEKAKRIDQLLASARRHGIRKVVHVGSCMTIHPKGRFFDADTRSIEGDLYGICKRLQEEMCRQFHDAHGMSTVVLPMLRPAAIMKPLAMMW